MDLLKTHRRRSGLSEMAYIGLNIALAITLLIVIRVTQSPWLALTLVLLSKWRALAVRPRFWVANLIANMVDIIVGVSAVILMYAASDYVWVQMGIVTLFIVWLLVIKPRSKRTYVALQAGVAIFVGITSLSIISYQWDAAYFVLAMWVLGYVVVRHVLGSYDEPHIILYSMIGGLLFAEIGWIGFHWLAAYAVFGKQATIHFSQLALFVTLLSFVAERAYASYHTHGAVRWNKSEVLMPIMLTIFVMIATYVIAVFLQSSVL